MRGLLLRALPVCFVALTTGCFLTEPFVGTPVAPPTPTHAYWQQVNAILGEKATGRELKDNIALIQRQTDQLLNLSPEGVDQELVATVGELIRCEEDVIRIGAMFDNDATALKTNKEMAVTFSGANSKALEVKKKLKAMRAALNSRYNGGFASPGW